jgi:hypothetical protein
VTRHLRVARGKNTPLRWGAGRDCIIRRASGALRGPWPKGQWQRWTIAHVRVQRTHAHPRPRLGGVVGVPEGDGIGRCTRIVDNAASGQPRPRAWTDGGHACLAKLAQGKVCKILPQEEFKPHKVRYYLERRAPRRH